MIPVCLSLASLEVMGDGWSDPIRPESDHVQPLSIFLGDLRTKEKPKLEVVYGKYFHMELSAFSRANAEDPLFRGWSRLRHVRRARASANRTLNT